MIVRERQVWLAVRVVMSRSAEARQLTDDAGEHQEDERDADDERREIPGVDAMGVGERPEDAAVLLVDDDAPHDGRVRGEV